MPCGSATPVANKKRDRGPTLEHRTSALRYLRAELGAIATGASVGGERRRSAARAAGRGALPEKSEGAAHAHRGGGLRWLQRAGAAARFSQLPRYDADGGAAPDPPGGGARGARRRADIDRRNCCRSPLHQSRPLRPAVQRSVWEVPIRAPAGPRSTQRLSERRAAANDWRNPNRLIEAQQAASGASVSDPNCRGAINAFSVSPIRFSYRFAEGGRRTLINYEQRPLILHRTQADGGGLMRFLRAARLSHRDGIGSRRAICAPLCWSSSRPRWTNRAGLPPSAGSAAALDNNGAQSGTRA
jgi:hypothetical protein